MKSPAPKYGAEPLGDMDSFAFRQAGHALVDWIAQYLEDGGRYPVLFNLLPGDIRSHLPITAPETSVPMEGNSSRKSGASATCWSAPSGESYDTESRR